MTPIQPKPATNEWTASPIGEILHNGEVMATAFTYVQGKACVDAINAALAAEKQRSDELATEAREAMEMWRESDKQLAAEKERCRELEEELAQAVKLLKLEDIDAAIAKLENK
jgi:hypothetical protein